MALPILEKSYEWNVNQLCGHASDENLTLRNMWWTWKSALVGWSVGAATVWGSSDASANWDNTGGDWWTSEDKVIVADGIGSWIVLNLFGGGQLLMGRGDDGDPENGNLQYSPGGLYTGGAIRTLPTATDAYVWLNNSLNSFGRPQIGLCRMHCIHSTDGAQEWLVLHDNNNLQYYCLLSRPENTPTGWAPVGQHVHVTYGTFGGENRMTFAYLGPESGTGYWRFWYDGATRAGSLTSLFQAALCVPAQSAWIVNQWTGKEILTPISVASIEVGGRGWHGRVPDLFWGNEVNNDGDHWEADAGAPTFEWMQMGDLVFPWNGTPLQTIA